MFSGYQWAVRAKGTGGPGPNIWDDANAQVDDRGSLHLKITNNANPAGDTEWHCVELSTLHRLGLGRYQFQVIGQIDKLDRNVVLGLFKYPTPDVGADGTNEIDIEFARWGRATANNADYVVYPKSGPRAPRDNVEFSVALKGDYTTHRFLWESDRVTFQSLYGHRDDDAERGAPDPATVYSGAHESLAVSRNGAVRPRRGRDYYKSVCLHASRST
jgi:hypothetical protein